MSQDEKRILRERKRMSYYESQYQNEDYTPHGALYGAQSTKKDAQKKMSIAKLLAKFVNTSNAKCQQIVPHGEIQPLTLNDESQVLPQQKEEEEHEESFAVVRSTTQNLITLKPLLTKKVQDVIISTEIAAQKQDLGPKEEFWDNTSRIKPFATQLEAKLDNQHDFSSQKIENTITKNIPPVEKAQKPTTDAKDSFKEKK